MHLLQPLTLGATDSVLVPNLRLANRVMFGPHVTNLGDLDRRLTTRHTSYYERRARGGCGTIVVEGASVHDSDWPYERAPLAERCAEGWAEIVTACHPHGAAVIASLDHAGGQGSSAYNQRELWAPSRVPEVNTREVPKWMEADDIATVIAGFGRAAATVAAAGCDGVEINAGQHSLVRQFLSGLTNHRDDVWGQDRLQFAREVLTATRDGLGGGVLGLRLSCDELAPWAGITPDIAVEIARQLAPLVDYLVVTRGSIYSVDKTRADFHEPAGYNIDLCRQVKAAIGDTPVFLQGSIVDHGQADWAIGEGVCDAVEMTRAQITDPDLVRKTQQGLRVRPCLRCNQTCQVRDVRSPEVTCVAEPTSGRETEDPDWYAAAAQPRDVLVIVPAWRYGFGTGSGAPPTDIIGSLGGVAALAGQGRGVSVGEQQLTAGVVVRRSRVHRRARAGGRAVHRQPAGVPTYDVAAGAVVLG